MRKTLITLALVAMPCAPVAAQTRVTAPQAAARASENKEVIRAAFDRWAAGGSTFFDEVLTPDMVWTIPGSGEGTGSYRGLENLKRRVIAPFSARLATPIRPRVQAIWAEGDHVIVHWRGAATTRAGKPYRNEYVWIFRMRDGRAFEVTAFLDMDAYRAVLADS